MLYSFNGSKSEYSQFENNVMEGYLMKKMI